MDRRVVFAMVASVLFLMAYSMLAKRYAPPPPPPDGGGGDPIQQVAQGTGGAATGVPTQPAVVPVVPALPAAGVPAARIEGPETLTELRVGRLHLTATSLGGALTSVTTHACEYHQNGVATDAVGDPGRTTERPPGMPGLLSIDLIDQGLGLHAKTWDIEETDAGLIARLSLAEYGLDIEKRLRPSRDAAAPYHVDVDIVFRGREGATSRAALVEVIGPWLAETEVPRPEDAVLVTVRGDDISDTLPDKIRSQLEDDPQHHFAAPDGVRMIGARADFHLGVLSPRDGPGSSVEVRFLSAERPAGLSLNGEAGDDESLWTTAAPVLVERVTLPEAGGTTTLSYRYFAGPASRPVFGSEDSAYADLAEAVPNRDFWIFSFKPIEKVLAWLLNLIAGIGIGYGWAVVVLTVLVRGLMFPLSRKSQVSMRLHGKKMALLKPKMEAVKKKYKDSKKQQQMTMKLMREEKVSLLPGGCLLAFVQMPIWIALYGILQTTFEMRHASFFWAADLTAPDHFLELPFTQGWMVVDGWLNLFPILMMITWGISSHMTPLPDDPQQRSQAKMMRWMPMLFGVFLYGFASGLTLYMTMSALWSICEVQLIRRLWLNKIDAEYADRLAALVPAK